MEEQENQETPENQTEEQPEQSVPPETFTLTREQMEKLNNLAAQSAALNDKYLRLAAEYDNYRKRTSREKENTYQDAKIATISSFLEVYDNLERAVQQAGDEENVHKKGMEMIFHQLENVLEKLGVTVEDPTGQPFDPLKHSAVMHVEDGNLGENVVSQVFQKGFLLGDKVIRFASVQVAN
ncbi:MAG: nucleotide exchange factor GrpE [Oscillospiraceae bacterium]|nr:nucleotide exchange factor GrpE [Oscillospiraceae bacterium]